MHLKKFLLSLATIIGGISIMDSALASRPDLDAKIGQMIMVGIEGTSARDKGVQEAITQAEKGMLGGIIYFSYNIKSPDQIQALTRTFKNLAVKYPLFQAIDQEGGKVQRLKKENGFENFLSAKEIAKQMTPVEAEKYYGQMAAQTAGAGFNLVLGPVVDLHADPRTDKPCPVIGGMNRSFSSSSKSVVDYAKSFINAHRTHKLATALKHYPGHGYATKDSHMGMVEITDTYHTDELLPFKSLIDQEFADMVMTAHLMNRLQDKKYPVTLSPTLLNNTIRDQLNYEGVVISDDLHMGAIGQHYSFEETVIQAIKAGCDILLFSNNRAAAKGVENFEPSPSIAVHVHQIVKQAIDQGDLREEQITRSYERIITLKRRMQEKELSNL